MNMKFLLTAVIIFTAGTGFLALQAASSANLRNKTGEILTSGITAEVPEKPVFPTEDTGASVSSAGYPTGGQAELLQDGGSILQARCQACHMVEALEAMKKTRSQWEKALTKMAGFGVDLSDGEKSVLLDYLAVSE